MPINTFFKPFFSDNSALSFPVIYLLVEIIVRWKLYMLVTPIVSTDLVILYPFKPVESFRT